MLMWSFLPFTICHKHTATVSLSNESAHFASFSIHCRAKYATICIDPRLNVKFVTPHYIQCIYNEQCKSRILIGVAEIVIRVQTHD